MMFVTTKIVKATRKSKQLLKKYEAATITADKEKGHSQGKRLCKSIELAPQPWEPLVAGPKEMLLAVYVFLT